jgi:GH25 family lysozyme M1 (1,4-beta-N-acetylmuramidase)
MDVWMTNDPGQSRPNAGISSIPSTGLQELEPRLLLSASGYDAQEPVLPISLDQPEVVASAGGAQILGIDVSVWQGSINWSSVAASGKEFAFIRAIDRHGVTDTRFINNMNGASSAGIAAGAYHFVSPWTDGFNDAVQEAALFASVLAPYITDDFLRPVIDIEAGPPLSPTPIELDNTVLTNWVHDYMAEFVRLTGVEPLIYTNTNHAQVAFDSGVNAYDLWLANWTNDPNNPPGGNADGVWNGYDLWQYSSTTSVPGIAGNVDGDVYFGDINQLIADYGIHSTPDDHGDDKDNATVVALPSTTAGNIENGLDSDWFELTLTVGEDYTFSVLADGLASGELRLYANTGSLLATDTGPASGGTLAELQYTPVASGVYYLSVESPTDAPGGYDLAVQEADDYGDTIATAVGPLTSFAPGGIQSSGDVDMFFFTATAGMQYDILLNDAGVPDGTLSLLNSGGFLVSQDSGSSPGGTHAQIQWTASSSGLMYVAASADPGSLGGYIVTLAESDPQIDGDLDGDGFVGIADLNLVLGNWNQSVTPGDLLAGDPDGDGFVGIADLNVVLGNWNAGTPPVENESSASQDEVVAPHIGTHTLGIDVSTHQGTINWSSVASSNIEFVWAKATEGVNFIDNKWVTNVNGAHNAGLLVGGYHFATPYTGGNDDAADEASDFYDALAPYLGDGFLRPVLDLEGSNTLSVTVLSNWVHDFMNTFSTLSGGIVPIIYTGTNHANNELNSSVNIYDLWFPRWPASPDFNNPPAAPGIWSSVGYDLWQYSGGGETIPGISGGVDGDVFHGDLSAFGAKYAIDTADDHGDDKDEATVVAVPSTTAGVIENTWDSDWFELTLAVGEDYTFSVLADGLASGELRLHANTGTQLAIDTGPASGGTLAELQYTPVASGVYYLSVESSGTGGYDLAVQETDDYGDTIATAVGPLTSFAPGGIQSSGDVDMFFFTATAGMQYDILLNDAGVPDGTLSLLNSGGFLVTQDSGSSPGGTHAQIQWTASSSGVMYVAASAGPGSLGGYIVTLAESDPQIDGDLDGDGFVGIADLNLVLGNWNQSVTPGDLLAGDPDGDGFVGIADLNVVLGNWNAGTPPAATNASQDETTASSVTQPTDVQRVARRADASDTPGDPPANTHHHEVPVAPVRTDRAQGLAIANWRASDRSVFGEGSTDRYTPAIGLWEQDDDE